MLILKKSIYIIFIIITIISCTKVGNKEEVEPNNTFSTSTEINLNTVFTGLIESENDIDNFLLKVNEDQIIHLELSAVKGINHAIHIHRIENSKPQLIKIIDDNRKSSPEEMSNLYVHSGAYIITITHGSGDIKKGNTESRYSLKITSRSYLNEEKEPNDSMQNANQINSDDIITGYFSPSRNCINENSQFPYREEDWYKTDIATDEDNPVTVDINLKGCPGVDTILYLYGPDMKEIAVSDNTTSGGNESITGIGLKVSGTYYFCVTNKSYQSNNTASYELSFKHNIHDSSTELESNNNFDNANKMTGNEISGRINNSGDQDYFIYSGMNNTNARIRLRNDQGLDSILSVYNHEKIKILEANNNTAGYDEIIPSVFIKDLIYIKITSSIVTTQNNSYKLNIEAIDIAGDVETEPNDKIKEATNIENEITGFTSYKTDKDYYLIKTSERMKFKIGIEPPKHGTIKISTTDQLGYLIKTKSAGNDEYIQMIEMFDKKGYLLIETVVPDYESPYKLFIEETK